ncbi:hypothetical protein [Terriglobus roseus]|nr:hypothetical protein [Terriglobus roseus]
MTELQAASSEAVLVEGSDPSQRVIHAYPGRSVRVTYDLTRDWTGTFKHPLQFHPVLDPEYLEFTGSNGLVRLGLGNDEIETAHFDWSALPRGWVLATSFGSSRSSSGLCQTKTAPWRDIHGALYAAGDFRLHDFSINGKPALLAIRGAWQFSDEDAVSDIRDVVGMVRRFWHDDHFPSFLVTLAPYDQDHGSSDGSAFTDAFWMFVSKRDQIKGLLPQLAHESFHAWNPKRMGRIPVGYDERNIRWFDEGTTEYYAQLLTLRAGAMTSTAYISSLNKDLRRFPTSTDEYIRGRVISLWLDGTIRDESHNKHSLDDVMFDMVKGASRPLTFERLLATIDKYLSPSSQALLQQAVVDYGMLPAPARIPRQESCGKAAVESLPAYELGFDLKMSSSTMTVAGVADGGPAFLAGLRNGQKLLGFSVRNGDTDHLATFRVSTDSGDKRLSYYPRGSSVEVWQYTATSDNCLGSLETRP